MSIFFFFSMGSIKNKGPSFFVLTHKTKPYGSLPTAGMVVALYQAFFRRDSSDKNKRNSTVLSGVIFDKIYAHQPQYSFRRKLWATMCCTTLFCLRKTVNSRSSFHNFGNAF